MTKDELTRARRAEKGREGLLIALVVGTLIAWTWLTSVTDERNELRDRFTRVSRDYSAATARGYKLEERLATIRTAVPKARERGWERGYQDGRRDAIRETCNAIYGTGPTLEGVVLRDGSIGDTWSRSYHGGLAIIRAIVVVVSLEDGSSHRITRSECMLRIKYY